MEFREKTVMMTGAAGRLGRDAVLRFVREGARLILTDGAAEGLERIAGLAAAAGGQVTAIPADITRRSDVERVVAMGTEALGPIDVLINFAGYVPTVAILDFTEEEWDRVFNVNCKGTMLAAQAVARHMIGAGRPGCIVNLSSGASTSARAGGAAYCGSKAAVNMMTHVMATEWGPYGIRVNAVAPGLVMDQVLRKGDETPFPYAADMLKATPLGRTGAPADITEAILFLASERSAWVTGEIIHVTGGSHCGRTHMALAMGLPKAPPVAPSR